MTYNVFGGTLSLTQSINQSTSVSLKTTLTDLIWTFLVIRSTVHFQNVRFTNVHVAPTKGLFRFRSQEQFAVSCTDYRSTNGLSVNSIWWSTSANITGLHHTCRHSVCRPHLSQLVVTCRLQPTRSEFSTYKNCYSWFSCFCSFWTCWNSLPSSLKSSSLQPEQFRRQLKTTLVAQPSSNSVTRLSAQTNLQH